MAAKKSPKKRKRNYKKEYANYHSKPKAKKQRARNNKANRDAGTYGNGDGKDIAHKLKKQSPSKNRSFSRTKTAKRKKK